MHTERQSAALRPLEDVAPRPALDAVLRGLRSRCPACGEGPLFASNLKTHDYCPSCGASTITYITFHLTLHERNEQCSKPEITELHAWPIDAIRVTASGELRHRALLHRVLQTKTTGEADTEILAAAKEFDGAGV